MTLNTHELHARCLGKMEENWNYYGIDGCHQEFVRIKEETAALEPPPPPGQPLESMCENPSHPPHHSLGDGTYATSHFSTVHPKEEEAENGQFSSLQDAECCKDEAPYVEASRLDSEECGVSELAMLASFYAGHEVKDELVLGPEHPHRPDDGLVVLGWALADADGCLCESVESLVRTQVRVTRECSVRLERLPDDPLLARNERDIATHANTESDTKEEIKVDCEKKLMCHLCGEIFAEKSDLIGHVILHIHMPISIGQEEFEDSVVDYEFPGAGVKQKSAREQSYGRVIPLRDCCVRLERLHSDAPLAAHRRRTPADTTTRADTESDTEHKLYTKVECKKLICDLCGEKFTLTSDLFNHVMIHIYTPTSATHQSASSHNGASPNNGSYLLNDKRLGKAEIHGINTYECDSCGATFEKKCLLMRHIERHARKTSELSLKRSKPSLGTDGKLYCCDICGKICTQKVHLVIHLRVHSGEKPYSCEIRANQFRTSGALVSHKLIHSDEKQYSCQTCHKRFRHLSSLQNHKLVHTGERPYTCEICQAKFANLSNLKSHRRTHSKERPYSCKICYKSFKRLDYLRTHNLIHEDTKPYCCGICEKTFRQKGGLRIHERSHGTERPYSCEICKMAFKSNGALKQHKVIHSEIKLYSCDVRQKKFMRADTLRTHKRIHTGIKPYSCKICKKKFTQAGHLSIHSFIHSSIKAYSCEICEKKFVSLDRLKKHIKFHTDIKPYSCEICSRKFKARSFMNMHKRVHSSARPYSCDICQKTFRFSKYLSVHKQTHTGYKPYTCDICQLKFSQLSNLKTHKQRHHFSVPYVCEICNKTFREVSSLETHKKYHDTKRPYGCEICQCRYMLMYQLERHRLVHAKPKYSCKKEFTRKDSLTCHKIIHTGEKPYSCESCGRQFGLSTSLKRHKDSMHRGKKS